MNKNLKVNTSININASTSEVWDVLTNPEKVKLYMFGTELICDWNVGSPIVFQGEYDGHKYKDGGKILSIENNQLLSYRYWSSFSGMEDTEENYSIVTYKLVGNGDTTTLHLSQQGFSNQDACDHSDKNWAMVLDAVKKMAEEA